MTETTETGPMVTAMAYVLAVPSVVVALALMFYGGMFVETWAAMTIWRWYAPWPLPFGLIAGVGMNTAASMVFRSMTHAKDERSGTEKIRDIALFYFAAPLTALGVMWLLRFAA